MEKSGMAVGAALMGSHVVGAGEKETAARTRQPNILFIFSDQQRWDTVGCYGDNMGRALGLSPNLDALAAEGVRFQHAFTCQPVCGPARACLQTGLYATETGCWHNDIALPLDAVTLPRLLKPAGYETGYIGKWHLASTGNHPDHHTTAVPPECRGGYDDFWLASDVLEFTSHGYDGHLFGRDMKQVDFPKGRYRVDALTDFAVDYLHKRDSQRPFFLFLSYIEPHHQNDHGHFEGPEGSKERFKNFPVPGDLEGAPGDWQTELPDYLGCCGSLDTAVGRLRKELVALGLAENTVIFYTCDHACHFRTRNSEYKRSCHDNSIRVPLIVSGPGFRGGRTVNALASLIDLPPTILAAGGVAVPGAMRGRPLQALVDEKPQDWPEEIFVQISESQTGRAIRTARWKYAVRALEKSDRQGDGRAHSYHEDFLYDLEADPHERKNLVSDPAFDRVRAELRERLKRRMEAAGESVPEILPANA
jgi:uncharacterized sulfatase